MALNDFIEKNWFYISIIVILVLIGTNIYTYKELNSISSNPFTYGAKMIQDAGTNVTCLCSAVGYDTMFYDAERIWFEGEEVSLDWLSKVDNSSKTP